MMLVCREFRVCSPQYRPLAVPSPQSTRNAGLAGVSGCAGPRNGPKGTRVNSENLRGACTHHGAGCVRGRGSAYALIISRWLARDQTGPLDLPSTLGVTGADTGALNASVCGANAWKDGTRALAGLGLVRAFSQRRVSSHAGLSSAGGRLQRMPPRSGCGRFCGPSFTNTRGRR